MGMVAKQLPLWLGAMDELGWGMFGIGLAIVLGSLVWFGHMLGQR